MKTQLALYYRPRRFSEIAGQTSAILVLSEMLKRWQLGEIDMPVGLLFTGQKGIGKTSAARIVASYLNCLSEQNRPCGRCAQCLSVIKLNSDAVLEVDGATSGLVDDVRNLAKIARLTHSGRYRVIIIDEVHAASKEAMSALLKQLEEPPPNVTYILVTTEYQLVPETIRGRCLNFIFNAISIEDISNRLHHIATKEHLQSEKGIFELIANRSGGSMRDAIMYLEQLVIINDLTIKRFKSLWPDELSTFAEQFIETAKAQDTVTAMKIIRKAHLVYHDNIRVTDSIIEYLKNCAIKKMKGEDIHLTQNNIIKLMHKLWDLRVSLKSALSGDPIMVEALWFLFSDELSNGNNATISVSTGKSVFKDSEDI